MTGLSDSAFHLLPRPASIRRLGGSVRLDELKARLGAGWSRTRTDPSLPAEGYRLRLDRDGLLVTLSPNDGRGRQHAERVLTQLEVQFGGQFGRQVRGQVRGGLGGEIPCVEVEDGPAFATRGVMLDVSRCRVPTMETLTDTVDLLGSLGANHLQLYTEHAFAYAGHEAVWEGASPITPEDIRRIARRCEERGLALAANQNCFGHLTRWFSRPGYAHLAEIQGDGEWDFDGMRRSGPFSLCPIDPGSIKLVRGLLDQLLPHFPHFPSGLVNIGCDETADVGQGRSAVAVRERGSRVYADFVSQVARAAMERGFRPMFWADIALKHPEALESLPREMIALAWGYEPDAPFDRWCDVLREAGFAAWVCPGTSSWRSFTGRTSERRENLAAAALAVGHGATGMLITDWGDLGHRQQWPVSLRGIADGLESAWSGNRHGGRPPEPTAVDLHVFGGARGVASWLDELGDADEPLRATCGGRGPNGEVIRLRNASAVFNDLGLAMSAPERPGDPRLWREALERFVDLEGRVPAAPSPLGDELHLAVRTARVACERAVALRSGASGERVQRIADELDEVSAEHRRLWLVRSRPGGLEESDGHYRRAIEELRRAREPERTVSR